MPKNKIINFKNINDGYEQIKDIISHIDEFHHEAELRESLQEIVFICEDYIKRESSTDKPNRK